MCIIKSDWRAEITHALGRPLHVICCLSACLPGAHPSIPAAQPPTTLSCTVTSFTVIGTPGSSRRATASTVLTAGRAAAAAAGFLEPRDLLLPCCFLRLAPAAALPMTTVTPVMVKGSHGAAACRSWPSAPARPPAWLRALVLLLLVVGAADLHAMLSTVRLCNGPCSTGTGHTAARCVYAVCGFAAGHCRAAGWHRNHAAPITDCEQLTLASCSCTPVIEPSDKLV